MKIKTLLLTTVLVASQAFTYASAASKLPTPEAPITKSAHSLGISCGGCSGK